MLRESRQQALLEELERAGSVSVAALSRGLGVSDITVRRDLEELSARNMLRKVHGGAVPVPKTAAEPHFVQKQKLNRTEKRVIARAALGFVNDGDTVAFSAGTTTWQIAEALRREVPDAFGRAGRPLRRPDHKDAQRGRAVSGRTRCGHGGGADHAQRGRGGDRRLPH